MRKTVVLGLLTLLGGLALYAQDVTGSIGGSILDPTGSAVPNAKVTIKNTDRDQVVRDLTTDATGTYSAPYIPVGTYSIKVECSGFKTEERTGIALNVADNLRINVRLTVGATSETVEVTAAAAVVELGSPSSSSTIEGTQITELSTAARNYEQYMSLMPGVMPNAYDELYVGNTAPGGATNTIPFSVNGQRNSASNWTVDGADNVDRGSNQTLQTYPSIDAIYQFKVERALYTADSGRAGGAQINVVTRGGTAKFHGTIYEFFRNDRLNANTWNNNSNKVNLFDSSNPFNNCSTNFTSTCYARIPPVRWNNYGFTIGGPVAFGGYNKEKNKTFFFYSQEFRKIISYATFNPTLPTTGMLTGQMIQPVCLMGTDQTCPAGSAPVTQIPTSLIHANSKAWINDIFNKLPLLSGSTVATTTSGFYPVKSIFNSRQEIIRLDHNVNQKMSIWGRVTIDDIPTQEPSGLFLGSTVPNGGATKTNSPGRGVVAHAINILKPSLVNDLGFNFSQSAIVTEPVGLTAKTNATSINPKEPFKNPLGVVPSLAVTGMSSIVGNGPYADYNRNYAWFDNLTWIKGRHNFKFGYAGNRYNKTENANGGAQGTFTFGIGTGTPTGTSSFQQAWANFLLGNVTTFTQSSLDVTPDIWAWQHEMYAQDDFKISSRLTVYAGVRWSFYGQPSETNGYLSNFSSAAYDASKAPKIDVTNGRVIAGTTGWQTNGIIIAGKNSPFGNKIANDAWRNFAPRFGLAWDPVGDGKTSVRAGYGVYFDSALFGIYEQNIFANPPLVASVTYTNASFSDVTTGTAGIDPLGPNATSVLAPRSTQIPANVPYSQQWSLNIQRQLPTGAVLEVGYFGSKGTHLLGAIDMNQAPAGWALAAGLHQPNGSTIFTSADWPRINAIRPFKGFNAFTGIQSAFDSNYHSLQMHFRKNFRGGGLFDMSYTFAKTLTNNSSDRSHAPQNSYDFDAEYGLASFNRKHVLSFNYVYTLPFFKRGRGVLPSTLGGWQLSGILQTYSGQPVRITTSGVDPAGSGIGNGGPSSIRPDQVCNPNTSAPHQYAGAAQSAGLTWFNTACYAPVPNGQVRAGNSSPFVTIGPGFFNLDASIMKNFNLSKEGRFKLQLRGESFNTLNWVNPNGISTGLTATTFGQVTSFRAARRMQLGAKINF